MAITSVKTGSSFKNLQKYDSFLAGNTAYDPSATWLIQRVSPTSGTSITFSSIPQTYSSLQIRANYLLNISDSMFIQFNGDTTSTYNAHYLNGNGTTVTAGSRLSTSGIAALNVSGGGLTYPANFIYDVLDYTSTTKYKTGRSISGYNDNSTGANLELDSMAWRSTAAVTSITLFQNRTFQTGTTFALYGIK